METRFWIAAVLCLASVACGPQPEAHHPTTETPANKEALEAQGESGDKASDGSADEPTSRAEPKPKSKALSSEEVEHEGKASDEPQSAEPAKSRPAKVAPNPGVATICDKITQRANQKCSRQVAELYQSSCNHYLQRPGSCDEQIRLALECQYRATDELLCAHEADHNCSQVNRELKICQRGSAPAEQTTAEDDRTLPSGWEQVEDKQLGFTVAMPPGATLEAESKRRSWKAEEGGISYYVAAIDSPSGKLDNQAFVRTVIAYVGNRCQRHLKLHGHLEVKGTTVVQYHSACPDGTEWHGMLHFWNGKAVSTGYHAPTGATGVREPYFYSLQIAK